MTAPLDDLPAARIAPAVDVLRKLRRGEAFEAHNGSPEFLAVVDLVRLGWAEFAGTDPVRLGVRLRPDAGGGG